MEQPPRPAKDSSASGASISPIPSDLASLVEDFANIVAVIRPGDGVHIALEFRGVERHGAALKATHGASVSLWFPPQGMGEGTVIYNPSVPGGIAPDRRLPSAQTLFSRVTFPLAEGKSFSDLSGLFDALLVRVDPTSGRRTAEVIGLVGRDQASFAATDPGSHSALLNHLFAPGSPATAIEIAYRVVFGGLGQSASPQFTFPTAPPTAEPNVRRPLWRAQLVAGHLHLLTTRDAEEAPTGEYPEFSLTPTQRARILNSNLDSDFPPLEGTRLALSGFGGWLDLDVRFPGSDPDALVNRWTHQTRQGRDECVTVSEKGFLYPIALRANHVTRTQRRIIPDRDGRPIAALEKRHYVELVDRKLELDKFQDATAEAMPIVEARRRFGSWTLLDLSAAPSRTPDLDPLPMLQFKSPDSNDAFAGRPKTPPADDDSVFWIRSRGEDILYPIDISDGTPDAISVPTLAAMVFVRADVAAQPAQMEWVRREYERTGGTRRDWHLRDHSMTLVESAARPTGGSDIPRQPIRSVRLSSSPVHVKPDDHHKPEDLQPPRFLPAIESAQVRLPDLESLAAPAAAAVDRLTALDKKLRASLRRAAAFVAGLPTQLDPLLASAQELPAILASKQVVAAHVQQIREAVRSASEVVEGARIRAAEIAAWDFNRWTMRGFADAAKAFVAEAGESVTDSWAASIRRLSEVTDQLTAAIESLGDDGPGVVALTELRKGLENALDALRIPQAAPATDASDLAKALWSCVQDEPASQWLWSELSSQVPDTIDETLRRAWDLRRAVTDTETLAKTALSGARDAIAKQLAALLQSEIAGSWGQEQKSRLKGLQARAATFSEDVSRLLSPTLAAIDAALSQSMDKKNWVDLPPLSITTTLNDIVNEVIARTSETQDAMDDIRSLVTREFEAEWQAILGELALNQLQSAERDLLANCTARIQSLAGYFAAAENELGDAAAALSGDAAVTVTIQFFDDYAKHGFTDPALDPIRVWAVLDQALPVPFDPGQVAGVLIPEARVVALSLDHGPLSLWKDTASQSQELVSAVLAQLGNPPTIKSSVAGILRDLKIFGVASISDALGDLAPNNVPGLTVDRSGGEWRVRYKWDCPVNRSTGIFRPSTDHENPCTLHFTSEMWFEAIGNRRGRLTKRQCEVCLGDDRSSTARFTLALFGVLEIDFRSVTWSMQLGGGSLLRPRIDALRLSGDLDFFQSLIQALEHDRLSVPTLGFGKDAIDVGYRFALPDAAFGAIGIANLAIDAGLRLPLSGGAMRVRLGLGSRDHPFDVFVSLLAGGGYLVVGLSTETHGIEQLELGVEFGGMLTIDLFVARGSVYAMGGIWAAYQDDHAVVGGYLRVGGSIEVLGILTVSIVCYLGLHYDGSQIVGEAIVSVEIHLLFFSDSVTFRIRRTMPKPTRGGRVLSLVRAPAADDPALHEYLGAFDVAISE
jgi:hypothetical protein